MVDLVIDEEKERKDILKEYRQLVKMAAPRMKPGDDKRLRKAFEVAVDAHKLENLIYFILLLLLKL
jgi:hypothetical protein